MNLNIIFIFAIALIAWLIIFFICKGNVKSKLLGKGYTVISVKWAPFGYGWFGEKDAIIFKAKYQDETGMTHTTYCKSGIFSGVYFSNDDLID